MLRTYVTSGVIRRQRFDQNVPFFSGIDDFESSFLGPSLCYRNVDVGFFVEY